MKGEHGHNGNTMVLNTVYEYTRFHCILTGKIKDLLMQNWLIYRLVEDIVDGDFNTVVS